MVPGLPQLDVHTLSEDWALAASLEAHWILLSDSLGLKPSAWIDAQGDRMYGAVIHLKTRFDLADTIREDDDVACRCEIVALRKPHALSVTTFSVGGTAKAEVTLLTSMIKRRTRGSNKKFARTSDLWRDDDVDPETIEALLDEHHARKSEPEEGRVALETEIVRIRDFNTADFLYFKNFVVMAKAAEWVHGRGGPTRLNARRSVWYYGNVEDGDVVTSRVRERDDGALYVGHHAPDGRRIFTSSAEMETVEIAER